MGPPRRCLWVFGQRTERRNGFADLLIGLVVVVLLSLREGRLRSLGMLALLSVLAESRVNTVAKYSSISTRKLPKAPSVLTRDKNIIALSDHGDFHKMVKRYITVHAGCFCPGMMNNPRTIKSLIISKKIVRRQRCKVRSYKFQRELRSTEEHNDW